MALGSTKLGKMNANVHFNKPWLGICPIEMLIIIIYYLHKEGFSSIIVLK